MNKELIKTTIWDFHKVRYYLLGGVLYMEMEDLRTNQVVRITEDQFNIISIDLKNLRKWLVDRPKSPEEKTPEESPEEEEPREEC